MKNKTIIKNSALKIIIGCTVGFINGFFGGGAGMILVPALVNILRYDDKKAHATSLAVILPLSIISVIIYFINANTYTDWSVYLKIGCGFVAGGIVGALILKKINGKLLRIVFALIIIICGITQLF